MATRAAIIIEVKGKNHSYEGVYLHFDGYPEGAGQMLVDHYDNDAKVKNLISHGGISSLGEMIGEKQDFSSILSSSTKQCKFYHRDRGDELDIEELEYDEISKFADDCGAEFTYLYEGGVWMVKEEPQFKGLMSLLKKS
jgi:hypothetical protein|tara:strand:- start:624 stop:1040 length:417 start_codon:yes stop_codon:yes gene_type:complete